MPAHDDLDKKTKGSVNYRPAPAREKCGGCTMFQPMQSARMGACSLVAGVIDPDYVCDRWEPKR